MLKNKLFEDTMARIELQKKKNTVIHLLNDKQSLFIKELIGPSLSSILRASFHAREKVLFGEKVTEAAWRHDHDRLLIDFFVCEKSSETDPTTASDEKMMEALLEKFCADSSTRPT